MLLFFQRRKLGSVSVRMEHVAKTEEFFKTIEAAVDLETIILQILKEACDKIDHKFSFSIVLEIILTAFYFRPPIFTMTFFINKVTIFINKCTIFINKVTNFINKVAIFTMTSFSNQVTIFINEVTIFINKVTIFINKMTIFINEVTIFINKVAIFYVDDFSNPY